VVRVERYGRFWAVYAGEDLVVVAVYKRGAEEVARRLRAAQVPARPAAPAA
jgi:hypothetical protein